MSRLRVISLIIFVIAALAAHPTFAAVNDSITITVNPGARQAFGGLGFNLSDLTLLGWPASAADQKTFVQNMIRQSRFRNIVLWGNLWMNTPRDTTGADTTRVVINPMILNLVSWSQEAGVDFVMINPINDRPLGDHVKFWTQCARMWRNRGVNLNVMTFLNKANTGQNGRPDSGKKRREPAEVVAGVKLLRRTLDSLGMQDLRICSPSTIEWHPRTWLTYGDLYDFSDGDTAAYFGALTADSAAMSSIAALDLQTYGTSAGTWADSIARVNNKELWISLAATDAPVEWSATDPRGKNYTINGPIMAANCLANLNHGVSRWNYWILYDMVKSASVAAPQYFVRYHYLSAISTKFDQGAVFRRCSSDHARLPSPDMRWNYNLSAPGTVVPLQPDIIAAAARNPDSSWSVGIVNISNIRSQHKASDDSGTARTYRVTVAVPELQSVDSLRFTASNCVDVTGIKDAGTVVMRNGSMTLSLDAEQLVVLRSRSGASAVTHARARPVPGCGVREIARGIFRVDVTDAPASGARVTVVGVNGRIVVSREVRVGAAPAVDLRSAPPGTYVVNVNLGPRTARARIVVR